MVNKVILQGRLTADPEIRYTQSQVAVVEFTVAWSEKYKETENKCFLRCKAWRHAAEFLCKYFCKGQEIAIVGHLLTEEWEKDGERKSRTICLVDEANFCGSKSTGQNQPAAEQPKEDGGFINVPDDVTDEELPFN